MIPIHQWTDGGTHVKVLKCVDKDGQSHGGYQWPMTIGATGEIAVWNPEPVCDAGGFYGWAWGFALGDGKDIDWTTDRWIVLDVLPSDVVSIEGGKIKIRAWTIAALPATWSDALASVRAGYLSWAHQAPASTSGDCSAAVACGSDSRVRCGAYGALAVSWWHETHKRAEMRVGRTGCGDGSDELLKAGQHERRLFCRGVWYAADKVTGELVEVVP